MTARQFSVPPVFGRRLQRERESRHWSLREAGKESGLSASTVMRAEAGTDMALSGAIRLAQVYGVGLDALLAEAECGTCDGTPPSGFICSECGRGNVKDATTRGELG
jgi:transcriptional regulator with XRE-family HTH domain